MSRWGIYVHIPYCKSLCPYCDFNSYVSAEPPWGDLQEALVNELAARADAFPDTPVHSIFFGGGTPSLAPPHLVEAVIEAIARRWTLADSTEVTLEANPGTVNKQKFVDFAQAGINRISLGWQSTHNRLLKVLGRGHSALDGRLAFDAARAAGFTNVSLDLIFAVPSQTQEELASDIEHALALGPEHLSLYALTYHEGTPFYRHRASGTLRPVDVELELDMMEQIDAALTGAGYEHYEVSNYALPGRRARHNSLYWQGGCYLGVGPGAHSFMHQNWGVGYRWETVRDPRAYLVAHPTPGLPLVGSRDAAVAWAESLTPRQLLAERMLCGLRQTDGVSLEEPICQAHLAPVAQAAQIAQQRGWLNVQDSTLVPTALGLRHADALAELFF